jgi:hypothetical protein
MGVIMPATSFKSFFAKLFADVHEAYSEAAPEVQTILQGLGHFAAAAQPIADVTLAATGNAEAIPLANAAAAAAQTLATIAPGETSHQDTLKAIGAAAVQIAEASGNKDTAEHIASVINQVAP